MRAKSLVLIFIALGCGLIASIGISQVVDKKGPTLQNVETEPILVSLTDIDIQVKLDANNVRMEEWPKAKIPEGALRSLDQIKDRFTRMRLYKGEPILDAKLMADKEGVSIRIPEGKRVLPVKLEQDTVVGLISPGDRVDVMVFLRRSSEIPVTGTMTILRNVIVFSVGSNVERTLDKEGKPVEAKTVSLIVNKQEAERLSMASELGKLRLSLRRPDEVQDDAAEDTKTTLEEMLQNKGGGPVSGSGGPNLLEMLNSVPVPKETIPEVKPEPVLQPPKPEPVEMMIMSPNDIRKFTWGQRDQLPQEVPAATGSFLPGTTAPLPIAPPSAPQPVPPLPPSEPTSRIGK